jgi:GT2 family glycosyltransferase
MKDYPGTYPFVSVIVPVFNDSDRLRLCLQALQSQTYPQNKYEIIVVDNNSEEDISSLVDGFRNAKLVQEVQPGSYPARNKGLQEAVGKIIAFTDSDCKPAMDWLETGVRTILETPNCGLVGGRMDIFPKDAIKPTAIELYESVLAFRQSHFLEVGHFSVTANLLTYKHVFEKVGLFRQDLFSGGDTEWGQRVFDHGYHLVYDEDLVVSHPARRTLKQLWQKATRYAGGSYQLTRNHPKRFLWALLKDLYPGRNQFQIILHDQRLEGFWQRLRAFIIFMMFKYIRIFERIRILFGGTPGRI